MTPSKRNSPRRIRCLLKAALLIALSAPAALVSQNTEPASGTSEPDQDSRAGRIYREARPAVCILYRLDETGERISSGSAFHIGDGRLVTNYHVVAGLMKDKNETLELECGESRSNEQVELTALDVVHDLAVVQAEATFETAVRISKRIPEQGDAVYAMGNPLGLGIIIVEGTWGGPVERFPDHILFSGSLNAGMSGGPALNARGELIGVNVGDMGDDISFLVPASFARTLIENQNSEQAPEFDGWSPVLRDQLALAQRQTIEEILASEWEESELEGAIAPLEIGPGFTCSNTRSDREDDPLSTQAYRRCFNRRSIYLQRSSRTGGIEYLVEVHHAKRLGRLRFYAEYSDTYGRSLNPDHLGDDDNRDYKCHDARTRYGGQIWQTAICSREYDDFEGLYDLFLSTAALGTKDRGLLLQARIEGVEKTDGLRLLERLQRAVRWSE